jgi:signal transduction histidine kinase/CheY-like chemotaxis protein
VQRLNKPELDYVFEPLAIISADGKIIYYNHFFSAFTNLSPRKLEQLSLFFDIFAQGKESLQALFSAAMNSLDVEVGAEIELTMAVDPDQQYTVVPKVIPLPEEQYMVCFNDLSVEKRLHSKYLNQVDALKIAHDEMIQNNKLATIGQLSSTISHEINNPVSIALGYLEVIEEDLADNDDLNKVKQELHSSVFDIREALHRINSIIKNMRNFVSGGEDRKEYCSLYQIITRSVEMLHGNLDAASIEVEITSSIKDIIIYANVIKLEQVFVNLLKNSSDALKEKGPEGRKINIDMDESGQGLVTVKVSDNGPGVPRNLISRIFDPYFTTKKIEEGSGLGLSIVKMIVSMNKGDIYYCSTPTGGAEFVLNFPKIEVNSFTNSQSFQSKGIKKEGRRVLVIDNDVPILNILNKFLSDEGDAFLGSTSAEEALNIIESIDMDIDIIITDYSMPGMNGSEFAKKMREIGFKLPIYYMTSTAHAEAFQKDKDLYSISGLILKPFTKESILKTINPNEYKKRG